MYQSFFITSSWLNVLKKTYNLDIVLVKQIDNKKEEIVFVDFDKYIFNSNDVYLPFIIRGNKNHKKLISLPFTDYIDIDNDYFTRLSTKTLLEKYKDSEIEIRTSIDDERFEKKSIGYKHKLNLDDNEENIFKGFKVTQVQQPIRKAIKDGLNSKISVEISSIDEFYSLHLLTRRKLGVPIQPKKFFINIYNEIIKRGIGFLVLVYKDSNVISSGIFIGSENELIYKFSASHPDYLRFRPNNLMLWTAIQEAKKRGFRIFDFGRTELENEGLRKFKQGWGTIEEPLYYSYYPKAPNDSKFKWVKNKIVAPIIRTSPSFVCRLSGELFYKYFG